jgi:hypothetical protein
MVGGRKKKEKKGFENIKSEKIETEGKELNRIARVGKKTKPLRGP